MEIYENDYSSQEDYMMYELHEISHKMGEDNQNIDEINQEVIDVINKYNLNKIKIITVNST